MIKNLKFFSFISLSLIFVTGCTVDEISTLKKMVLVSPSPSVSVSPSASASPIASASPSVDPSLVPSASPSANLAAIFDIKKASEIVTNKCTYCHSINPNPASGRTRAAAGITFDSQQEIESQMDLIKKVTFTTRSMPVGNITITEEERALIGQWGTVAQQSPNLVNNNVNVDTNLKNSNDSDDSDTENEVEDDENENEVEENDD